MENTSKDTLTVAAATEGMRSALLRLAMAHARSQKTTFAEGVCRANAAVAVWDAGNFAEAIEYARGEGKWVEVA